MKKIVLVSALAAVSLGLSACEDTSTTTEEETVEEQQVGGGLEESTPTQEN